MFYNEVINDGGAFKMVDPLKITSTLADETRYSIYQHIIKNKEAFSVQEIADVFKIHPNVARLHLKKLTDIGVLHAEFEKTGKGGRPGRLYRATDDGVSLSFPYRDDSQLMDWLLDILEACGEEAIEVGKKICHKKGLESIQNLLRARHLQMTNLQIEQKVDLITETAALIGYIPIIRDTAEGKTMKFTVYNCPFHNGIAKHSNFICDLHESYLKGQFEALFDVNEFTQVESMVHDCKFCSYHVSV